MRVLCGGGGVSGAGAVGGSALFHVGQVSAGYCFGRSHFLISVRQNKTSLKSRSQRFSCTYMSVISCLIFLVNPVC